MVRILLILVLLSNGFVHSQNFEKKSGFPGCYNEGHSILPLPDKDILVSASYKCGGWISKLSKINSAGDTLWTKHDLPVNGKIKLLQDNTHFISIGGNIASLVYDSIRMVKADLSGNVTFSRSFALSACNNSAFDISPTSDGGFIFTGIYKDNCSNITFDGFIIKTDEFGDQQWMQQISGPGNDQLNVIKELPNGNFAAFGWTENFGSDKIDFLLVILDPSGNIISLKTFGGTGYQYGYGMDITNDGGFIITGHSDKQIIAKLDVNGRATWTKELALSCGSRYFQAQQMPNGGYSFLGTSYLNFECVSTLTHTDESGNITWTKNYDARIREFKLDENGKTFWMTGYSDYLPQEFVAKFDTVIRRFAVSLISKPVSKFFNQISTAKNQSGVQDELENIFQLEKIKRAVEQGINHEVLPVTVYPLPASEYAIIAFPNPEKISYSVTVYNIRGELMQSSGPVTDEQIVIKRNNLPAGTYLYKLQQEKGELYMGKIIFGY